MAQRKKWDTLVTLGRTSGELDDAFQVRDLIAGGSERVDPDRRITREARAGMAEYMGSEVELRVRGEVTDADTGEVSRMTLTRRIWFGEPDDVYRGYLSMLRSRVERDSGAVYDVSEIQIRPLEPGTKLSPLGDKPPRDTSGRFGTDPKPPRKRDERGRFTK